MEDYSYFGSGKIYLRKRSGTTGLLEIGNCSALKYSVDEDVKELPDYTTPGGGTRNEVRRIKSVTSSMTTSDLSPENVAMSLFGDASAVAAGDVVDEAITAKLGALVPLEHVQPTGVVVKSSDDATTYDAGTDYEVRPAGIYFPAEGSDILEGASAKVSYSYGAQNVVNALTSSAEEYELLFEGLNEARSGKPVIVRTWRQKMGSAKELSFIGSDYADISIEGKVLKDSSKPAGISQYFQVTILE
jgi:hypothetical protein